MFRQNLLLEEEFVLKTTITVGNAINAPMVGEVSCSFS